MVMSELGVSTYIGFTFKVRFFIKRELGHIVDINRFH